MDAGPNRRRSELARRPDGSNRRPDLPRRPDAPLRKPEPNLRRPEGVVRRPTLALDVGTAGTGAVLVTTERDTVIEDPDLGHSVWPSSVAFDGVAPRVGAAAENFCRVHPDCYRGRLKQVLGEPGEIPLGDRTFLPSDLVGWLLSGIREQAQRIAGIEVDRAVISVPVSQTEHDPRRQDLLEAARLAGFVTVELLSEPMATVTAPLTGGPLTPGDIVLVCDLGASSFTATLASMLKAGTIELLGHHENLECSGLEMDRLIMSELLTRAGRSWTDLVRTPDDPAARIRIARARRELEERARAMKHQLSTHPSAVELVGPDDVAVELTATELTALIAPMLYHAAEGFRGVLVDKGVRAGELAAVLLSGGGSRIPAVADVLAETFHRPIRGTVDSGRAVVEGAARFARSVERRHIRARVATDRETPLRWDVPGGQAGDLDWLLPVGSRFGASDPLGTVRLGDGSLWELRSGRAGTLIRTHLPNGSAVVSGDWLVTVELDVRPFR
jgi:molecular chaperone DnaK (HSP70)